MKQGWELKKLRDVILEIKDGGTPSRTKPEYFGGDVSWCVVKDISPEIYSTRENLTELGLSKCSAKVWPINSVIISLGATIGQVGIAKIPVATKQGISGIIVNQTLLKPELLVYYLNFQKDFIQRAATGATIKEVRPSKLADILEIPIPPLPEQQRIVAILDEAFAAIAKAKANAQQNLKNAKELFESYLQGVFENGNWETKTLNEISENLDSKRVPITKNVRNEGSIPYYGASGIVDYVADYLFDEDLLCVSEDGANLLARTYPIAFSISGKTWVNNHAHVLRFKNMVSQKFVELYLNSIKLNDFVSGMAQPKLNQTMLNKIPIPFPSLKEQGKIVSNLDTLSTETKKLETIYQQKINDLEELKKSVLQKAFSGELKTAKALV